MDIDDASDESLTDHYPEIDAPHGGFELTFVDMCSSRRTPYSPGPAQIELLTNTIQDIRHLLCRTPRILFRWPWIAGPGYNSHTSQINSWIERLTDDSAGDSVVDPTVEIGVVQHRISEEPDIISKYSAGPDVEQILYYARQIEMTALLRRHNAIWEPEGYHYRLPSGQHSDIFVRLADAIQEPRDAYVIACWLVDRLRERMGIIVDTGGLTPLMIQLESLLNQSGWQIGPTVILQAYPTGRSIVRRTVESAYNDQTSAILAVLSVNSTGTLYKTLLDELERVSDSTGLDYTLDVLVDLATNHDIQHSSNSNHLEISSSWLYLNRDPEAQLSAACEFCKNADKAPLVAVDPRTYAAMTLPKPHLVMPDVRYAAAGYLFWERVAEYRGTSIEVNPHPDRLISRSKRAAVPIRPIYELIIQPTNLVNLIKKRWRDLLHERDSHERNDSITLKEALTCTSLVVATDHDIDSVSVPKFAGDLNIDLTKSLRLVLSAIGLKNNVPIVTINDTRILSQRVGNLDPDDAILVFSWYSVTGLTLRRLKLAVADALGEHSKDHPVNGLVFHARCGSPNEWEAQRNQFRPDSLACLWESCFPWRSPLVDEYRILDRLDSMRADISSNGQKFLRQRMQMLEMHATYSEQEDDWSPRFELSDDDAHPEHIF